MSRGTLRLIEVIAVIVILVALGSLLLPSLGPHREAARRMQCGNNLKQLALGLQNYHDHHLFLPAGASAHSNINATERTNWGPSWFVAILPFADYGYVQTKIENARKRSPNATFIDPETRQAVSLNDMRIISCPSSNFPTQEGVDGLALRLASYAGIMGANNDQLDPVVTRQGPIGDVVRGPYGGWGAANGMLPINENLTFASCTDGTANTIIVGEVADWYFDDAGKKFITSLSVSDAGDGWRSAAGWLAGTNLKEPIRLGGSAVAADRICNLITISHPVGTNNRRGASDSQPNWGTKGIGRCGLNNPLSSAHPQRAMVAYLDGHVQMLTKATDLRVLQLLAIRCDNEPILELE